MTAFIGPDTPLSDLVGSSVIGEAQGWDGETVRFLLLVGRPRAGLCRVRFHTWDGEGWGPERVERTPVAATVSLMVQGTVQAELIRAVEAHLTWPDTVVESLRRPPLILTGGMIILGAILWPVAPWRPWLIVVGVALGICGAIMRAWQVHRLLRAAVLWEGVPIDLQRLTSHLDALAAGPGPVDRVAVVQEAYGELLGDIVYRIESSALFDAAVPQTQRFQVALVTWDPDATDADALATEVEESFAAARAYAEKVGLEHLPLTARGPARRAVKAAITALSGADAEREAAAGAAAGILRGLTLCYLPVIDPAQPSLIAARLGGARVDLAAG